MSNVLNRSVAIGAVAIVFAALAYGGVSAEEKKKAAEPKPAACKTLTADADCTARSDCGWVQASVDKKTGKKRKFLDGVPEKERTKLLQDILVNAEPKGYVETVAPITRHVKLT